MRLIDADRLLTDRAKGTYYHLPNGDTAIPIIDIEHAPTIEPKKGKWILVRDADETGNALYECSACHMGEVHVPIVEVNYCWNCGADMRTSE